MDTLIDLLTGLGAILLGIVLGIGAAYGMARLFGWWPK